MLVHRIVNWREWSVMKEGGATHSEPTKHEDFVRVAFICAESTGGRPHGVIDSHSHRHSDRSDSEAEESGSANPRVPVHKGTFSL